MQILCKYRTNSLDDNGPNEALALLAVIEDLTNLVVIYSIHNHTFDRTKFILNDTFKWGGNQSFILTRIDLY